MNWSELYIADDKGKEGWKTSASPMSAPSEINNLMRHVKAIRANDSAYTGLGFDAETVYLYVDGDKYYERVGDADLSLLDELMA